MSKAELIKQAEALGIAIPRKATVAWLQETIDNFTPTVEFVEVERPKSRRGRKTHVKHGMIAMIENWAKFEVGKTTILPDTPDYIVNQEGDELHSSLTNLRHHFRKYARPAGLNASVDYTIEFHPEHGATITRLS